MPWVRAHYRRPRRRHSTSSANGVVILAIVALAVIVAIIKIVAALIAAGVTFVSEHKVMVVIVGLVAAVTPLGIVVTRRRKRRAIERLETEVRALCTAAIITDAEVVGVEAQRRELSPLPLALEAEFEALYRGEVARALDDRLIDDKERHRLDDLARVLGLASSVIQQAELEAFLEVYADAVADDKLTASEEQTLTALQGTLRIPKESIQEQTEKLRKLGQERKDLLIELTTAREVVRGKVEPIECPRALRRGESCYFTSPFTEKRLKVVSSQRIAGMRLSEKDLVDERAGDLYVTDKRLLLLAGGTTSIALDKIFDIKVETSTQVLSVIVDGRKSAYYFEVPRPFVFAAFLHRARDGG